MKYLIVLLTIYLAGCTTTSRMNVVDLDYYQIDCSRRDEQLAFLKRQMPTKNERLTNGLAMTSVFGTASSISQGTYQEERATFDRKQEAIARIKIYQIESQCPPLPRQPQGCTHINENFPAGSTQGARCYSGEKTTPIVNRWEVK